MVYTLDKKWVQEQFMIEGEGGHEITDEERERQLRLIEYTIEQVLDHIKEEIDKLF